MEVIAADLVCSAVFTHWHTPPRRRSATRPQKKQLDFYLDLRFRRYFYTLAWRRPRLLRARDARTTALCVLPCLLAQETGAKTTFTHRHTPPLRHSAAKKNNLIFLWTCGFAAALTRSLCADRTSDVRETLIPPPLCVLLCLLAQETGAKTAFCGFSNFQKMTGSSSSSSRVLFYRDRFQQGSIETKINCVRESEHGEPGVTTTAP